MTKAGLCEIVVILDRSGSMAAIQRDMEGGFNSFIAEQKRVPGECLVSLHQFDTEYETVYVLNLSIVALGCYDDDDLVKTDTHSVFQPPDVHGKPDGGVPAAVSQAIIGSGMRSCWVAPEQGHGETVIWREAEGSYPGDCLVLQANLQPDVCNPAMHWYSGQALNDNIRKVQGYAYDKRCLKVQLFSEWMFGGTMTEYKACAGPGVYASIFQQNLTPNTSSIKTYYYACPNYPNCP